MSEEPGVIIDNTNERLAYLGNGNVLLLINGSGSGRSLSTIDPQDIDRIKAIDIPTARYGTEDVINIILKEDPKQGFRLITQLDYFWDNKRNFSNIQAEYQFSRFRIFRLYKPERRITI